LHAEDTENRDHRNYRNQHRRRAAQHAASLVTRVQATTGSSCPCWA
jgi:hypothetical protein